MELIQLLEDANFEGGLIKMLQLVQKKHGYISKENVQLISEKFDIPSAKIYGVITFYSQFRIEPVGKYTIKVCRGTACHVAGSEKLSRDLKEHLNLQDGKTTTTDMRFTVEEVACLGCCSLAPAVMINETVYGKLDLKKLKTILEEYK